MGLLGFSVALGCVWALLTQLVCAETVQEAQLLDSTQATQAAQLASNPHFMHDIFSRRLMNAAAATVATDTAATPGPGNTGNSVKLVKDAVGFVDAIAKNYAHIVVEQHLNLDNIPAENENLESLVSTGVPATVLSITVAQNQCVIVTGKDLISAKSGKLLLSDLYLRLNRNDQPSSQMIAVHGPGALWMTGMMVQGDANAQGCTALKTSDNGNLLVSDSRFSHIGGVSDGVSLGEGTSNFVNTSFNNSSIVSVDKALMRLFDGHKMLLQRVNFLNSPVDGGAVISTDGAPASFVFVGAVTSDGITSAGGILDRDSKTPGGRGAATSAANFTKLEPSDEWVQLVKKERDELLEQQAVAPAAAASAADEDSSATPSTPASPSSGSGNNLRLTVIVCVAVAGMCVLVAAILSFLLFCRKGGTEEVEGEVDANMKGVHPYMDDSIDGESKGNSLSDAASSHHNNRMFRLPSGTPFNNGSSNGPYPRINSSSLSNNQNVALSGSAGSGNALPPGVLQGKAAPTASGGGWYWPTLAQELDALKDTKESNSQQGLKDSNNSLNAQSPHTRTKESKNGASRPSRTISGGVMSTVPSPHTMGSNAPGSGGPNMLMHVSPIGAGPPDGIPISGNGDGFSNVFSGGVVSMAQSHHWGNTVKMKNSTARLPGGVGGAQYGLSGAPGMGPSEDSAAHYVHIELDHSDGAVSHSSLSKAQANAAAAVAAAEAEIGSSGGAQKRNNNTTTEIESATVPDVPKKEHSADPSTAGPSTKEGSAADSCPATVAESALQAAPSTPEPAQVKAPAPVKMRNMNSGADDLSVSPMSQPGPDSLRGFGFDAVSPMHSARTLTRGSQEAGQTGRSLTGSISRAVTDIKPRSSHRRNYSGTEPFTNSSDLLDYSQAGMSSTALMDTSRLVGPVVGKLLGSPAPPRTQEHDGSEHSNSNRLGSHSDRRNQPNSGSDPSSILHPPSTVLEPGAFLSSASESKQNLAVNGIASSVPGGRAQSALRSPAQGNANSNSQKDSRGSLLTKSQSGKSSRLESRYAGMQEAPDSPNSQTVSLSGGLESQTSGPSRTSLSPITKDTTVQGSLTPRKWGTRNSRLLHRDAALATSSQIQGDSSSVHVDSPTSAAAPNASFPLHPHSEVSPERSGAHIEPQTGINAMAAAQHAQHRGQGSPSTAQLSDGGSTAPMSSVFAPGAASRELQKLDVLAEDSEMNNSEMAGIGMPENHSAMQVKQAAIPEHDNALSSQLTLPTAVLRENPTQHLAMMYGSASQFPSQFPEGQSRAIPLSGYIPDMPIDNEQFSSFGNTGNNLPQQLTPAQHAYHSVHDTVPEMSTMGGNSSQMTGTSASAMGPSARLPLTSTSGVMGVSRSKPPPVAMLQSMSSRGGNSEMDPLRQFSEEPLADVPGASESTGLLSSESDFAPPQARSWPGVHTTTTSETPCYVPVTMDTRESTGGGEKRRRGPSVAANGQMQPLHNSPAAMGAVGASPNEFANSQANGQRMGQQRDIDNGSQASNPYNSRAKNAPIKKNNSGLHPVEEASVLDAQQSNGTGGQQQHSSSRVGSSASSSGRRQGSGGVVSNRYTERRASMQSSGRERQTTELREKYGVPKREKGNHSAKYRDGDGKQQLGQGPPHRVPPPESENSGNTASHSQPSLTETSQSFQIQPVPKPPADADIDTRMEYLHYQLDCIGTDREVLRGLKLLGAGRLERLQGGQAVVQIARDRLNGLEYAIKLFLSRRTFNVEAALYTDTTHPLGQFLPQVRNILSNDDASFTDPSGNVMPPCVVMERGESLDIWSARARPDRIQAFSVIQHIASRLASLHKAGYAHRDLKPGNVMWLPRENRWTIIDFGCAARIGSSARMGFSVLYAAPEVIQAFRNGQKTIVAQGALDSWALGILAYELFSGAPVLEAPQSQEDVMDRILGVNGKHMPWEGGRLPRTVRKRLGIFKNELLRLLDRDPVNRPSMDDFVETCNKILGGTSATIEMEYFSEHSEA